MKTLIKNTLKLAIGGALFVIAPLAYADCPDYIDGTVNNTGSYYWQGTSLNLFEGCTDEGPRHSDMVPHRVGDSGTCSRQTVADSRADGCSVPGGIDIGGYTTKFRAACDMHDACYSTLGKGKYECDAEFLANMTNMCGHDNPVYCLPAATAFYEAVKDFAGGSYSDDQKWADNTCK